MHAWSSSPVACGHFRVAIVSARSIPLTAGTVPNTGPLTWIRLSESRLSISSNANPGLAHRFNHRKAYHITAQRRRYKPPCLLAYSSLSSFSMCIRVSRICFDGTQTLTTLTIFRTHMASGRISPADQSPCP
ncbi:hypothetical protein PV11_05644 [Exophiala sideris]|uniref:Uncharacterized protein n=1 Tax=Exophiala sideris TaxID=1016849 RepID=A0A0D1ZA38_9EURO|nr:hypothetical protein PV11_05644 [Exophiala sideris]